MIRTAAVAALILAAAAVQAAEFKKIEASKIRTGSTLQKGTAKSGKLEKNIPSEKSIFAASRPGTIRRARGSGETDPADSGAVAGALVRTNLGTQVQPASIQRTHEVDAGTEIKQEASKARLVEQANTAFKGDRDKLPGEGGLNAGSSGGAASGGNGISVRTD